jgi:hypothetical protein
LKVLILFALVVLSGMILTPAFAESLISVETNSNSYKEGEAIVISGKVSTIITNKVTIQIFNQGNLVDIAQAILEEDGTFSHTVIAEGSMWSKAGEYTVRVSYGEGNIAETQFSYSPKIYGLTTSTWEVDTGNQGTFDVQYSIGGGIVKNMLVDKESLSLTTIIESADSGSKS